MVKCVICELRPAKVGGRCHQCNNDIAAMNTAKAKEQPSQFLTYRGHVVGLYPNKNRMLKARLLKRSDKHLPKTRTINLNIYCEGYSREVIKRFKACVLSLAHA